MVGVRTGQKHEFGRSQTLQNRQFNNDSMIFLANLEQKVTQTKDLSLQDNKQQ
jgi:hypothetical protein